jgi:hypothetical protein
MSFFDELRRRFRPRVALAAMDSGYFTQGYHRRFRRPTEEVPSKQSLQHRIRYHFAGNSEGSTLRLSLGCLLAGQLGIELRRVGSGKRYTFSTGEAKLSEWMEGHARVVWHVCDEPWKLEEELISSLDLPLNLDQNRRHGFQSVT